MLQLTNIQLIQIPLLLPLAAAFFAAVIPYRNVRDTIVVVIAAILPFVTYELYESFLSAVVPIEWRVSEIVPGAALYFHIEALGVIFAIILSVLWVVSIIYSIGYMRGNNEGRQCSFFTFYCFAIFAAMGIAFAGNLITLFIFYELLTLGTYPLITHHRTKEAIKAGRKYLGTLVSTSMLLLLPAILITFSVSGTVNFASGGILAGKLEGVAVLLLLAMFVFGIAKAAIMPVHKWLPAAMVAPTPVSALLHAVAIVKAGVFAITKIVVYTFGVEYLYNVMHEFSHYGNWLLYIASFTIIISSIVALTKDNIKQVLAYSTISQLSYVVMSLAMFSKKAVTAAVFQIVAHAFAKIVLFFAAGAVYTAAHKNKISEFGGLGRVMPVTFTAFTIAALSIIGIPPTVGFITKWYIFDAAMAGEEYLVVAVIAASTMLSAAYFLPVIYNAFFGKAVPGKIKQGEAPIQMLVSMSISVLIVLLLFIWPNFIVDLALMVGN